MTTKFRQISPGYKEAESPETVLSCIGSRTISWSSPDFDYGKSRGLEERAAINNDGEVTFQGLNNGRPYFTSLHLLEFRNYFTAKNGLTALEAVRARLIFEALEQGDYNK
ncbi:hypothetical protein J4479_00910 [Candidatus Woesearchaeota archaeon]|nr:hypothetical protein [Candidatus Woesearchaeota archaeon]